MSNRACISAIALTLLCGTALAGAPPKPPKEPAKVRISVTPEAVAPGSETLVTVRLEPKSGVKINRYPKIKLSVPEHEGLLPAAQAAVGNSSPPPPDKMDSNYFDTVDPVELRLKVDASAPSGSHTVDGKLTYFYCVIASGFCAPKRVPVSIALDVR